MALEVIKQLNEEIAALKEQLKNVEGSSEELKALADKVAELERKKDFMSGEKVSDRVIAEAEKKAADLKLKAAVLDRPVDSFAEYKEVASIVEKAIKPSDIAAWMDERFSNSIVELMELELKVERLFNSMTIPNGVEAVSIPQKTGRTTAYLIAPDTDAIESAVTAGKVTIKPVKLKTLVQIADETRNEAVVGAILDVIRQDIAHSLAKGTETAIVNGDTAGTLNGNPGANDVTMAFDGLRKYGDANKVDNGGGALTLANIRAARAKMGVFGVDPSELKLLVNPAVFYQLLQIPEVQTIDKIGNEAVIKTGTIAMVDGIDIVLTEVIPTNLNASGVVDTTTPGTLTAAVLVNTSGFLVGKRNAVEAERDRNIVRDVEILVGRRYVDFKKVVVEDTAAVTIVNVAS